MSSLLGTPLPNLPHAVSVSLPKWADIVGYEEGDQRIINTMQCGYPRFVYHPIVVKLFRKCEAKFAGKNEFCLAFPSKKVAEQCIKFINRRTGINSKIGEYSQGIFAVILPETTKQTAKEFWQHVGSGISSRQAESVLNNTKPANAEKTTTEIKRRIADISGYNTNNIYLYPSGAAAIFSAHQVVCDLMPGLKTIQLGFPYVDTLKVQEKFGTGAYFVDYRNENDLKQVEDILGKERIAGVFCEFPSNPLLHSINLEKLSILLRKYNVPLIIDDTLSSWFNVNLSNYADIIVTSLTKFFSGVGDVLAGSLIINDKSPIHDKIKIVVENNYENLLFPDDVIVLEKNSRDFINRIKTINHHTELLCNFLNGHPKISKVNYTKFVNKEDYDRVKKPDGGYGGLFSLMLKDPKESAAFYDALEIEKGPSLGTNFTLACPYTLLAHYNELDYAAKYGISPELIRVSVGLENPEIIITTFNKALKYL